MRLACFVIAVSGLLSQPVARAADDRAAFFESKVRPILATRCHACHGAKKQESGLRLDTKAGFVKGGDSGAVVVAEKPEESDLIKAVRREGLKMPPDQPLPTDEINTLVEWVRRGAFWPDDVAVPAGDLLKEAAKKHWAFQPVSSPPVPRLPNDEWSQTPLDRFVLAKQREAGLTPSPRADKRTLLRRVSIDLIGLPPTPEQMDEFLADDHPDAIERVVDRLLSSPHYGERWGRHWLDVARYADTKGYVFFEEKKFPWAWTYRDYVIRSLNEDLPFDRFVVEQLAADQLDLGDDKRPLAAMGFLTLGGRFMNNLHDVLDDRIDVVSRGLLGLTATCARCHDHKFDPVPQADYYGLYGVFRSSIEPPLPPEFLPPPQTEEYAKFSTEMNARLKKLNDFVIGKHSALVTSARVRAAEYLLAAQAQMEKPPTDDFMLIADTNDINPTMTLRWQAVLEAARKKPHPVWQPWTEFAALPADQFAAKAAEVCSSLKSGREPMADGRKPFSVSCNSLVLSAVCEPPPTSFNEVATRYGELLKRIDAKWQETLKQQPAATSLADPHEEEVRRVLYGPDAPPDVPLAMGWGFLSLFPDRPTQGEYQKLIKEVEQWSMTAAGAPARAMILVDDASPYEPRVFLRGNPNRPGASVSRHGLDVASPERQPFAKGSGRLEFARSLVDPRNPLTARVFVNRVWLHHFGTGLVKTPSDFGLRSDPPSHPELLDWLAANFVKSGWSVKWLHRQILLSSVYQQSSFNRDSLRSESNADRRSKIALPPNALLRESRLNEADPDNRLLSHANRRRLEWESLRDSLLFVSGDLNHRVGGESFELLNGFVPRRSLYGTLDRLDVPNLLTTFDFPTPAASNPQRDSTTVAPQALFLMNGDLTFEVASRLLRRPEVVAAADTPSRVRQLFLISLQRTPTDAEQQAAREFLSDAPTPERWTAFAQSLLLANEFAFVD
jgi:cytochrome c553